MGEEQRVEIISSAEGTELRLRFDPELKRFAHLLWKELEEIRERGAAQRGVIDLYPHARADGDAYASAFSFSLVLQKLGFASRVLLSEEVSPPFSRYLREGFPGADSVSAIPEIRVVRDGAPQEAGGGECGGFAEEAVNGAGRLAILLDCHEGKRTEAREPLFAAAERKMAVDHHHVATPPAFPCYVRSSAAANALVLSELYMILEQLSGRELTDAAVAAWLYTGLLTDSNRFTYQAVDAACLCTAAVLRAKGVNQEPLIRALFETRSRAELRAEELLLRNLRSYEDGKIHVSLLRRREMEEAALTDDDLGFAPAFLREIEGACLTLFLRETEGGNLRGNVRSVAPYSARRVAEEYGGGGHECAAGFSLPVMKGEDVTARLVERLKQEIRRAEAKNT